ncbi:EAL domain-containing protein [Sulfurimonas sp.]|uniref:EAL domain-containing protein n=1 Tax=Sulfurimonas sp. TaxID=2022749 RepID=UPI0026319554|nr:GGDEF domain-containing phosphodiesterase [Sulfurimonas sp.]MDD5157196.1 GGDEF domain-containing phosphodiesterase [Sulfurimonas sp.]
MNCGKIVDIDERSALIKYLDEIPYANLLLVDVDNFSNFNNMYGFDFGDRVLIEISRLIDISKPALSRVFRINFDEFAIVNLEMLDTKQLSNMAESMISFFNQIDIDVDDISVKASISVGISIGKGNNILNHARTAIKELREHSRGSSKIYDSNSEFIKKQKENVYWINKLRDAFENESLQPFFQPIINNKTKKIEKYECLVRIRDEETIISPYRFMEASKLTGTLSLVTRTMIEQSFKMFSNNDYEFSINITNADLYLNYLENFLLKQSRKYNINPSRVVLEILEDIDSLDSPEILLQLNSLRYHGFKIAIDDFGSRSSNFSRLLEFSPDYLKIDGSFIKNILEDKNSLIIVESIVFLCKKSNIKIIAEFVHSAEVQAKIEELEIDYSQGYYFGEPKAEVNYT